MWTEAAHKLTDAAAWFMGGGTVGVLVYPFIQRWWADGET